MNRPAGDIGRLHCVYFRLIIYILFRQHLGDLVWEIGVSMESLAKCSQRYLPFY